MNRDLNSLLVSIGWIAPPPKPKPSLGLDLVGVVASVWGLLATLAVLRAGWREMRAR